MAKINLSKKTALNIFKIGISTALKSVFIDVLIDFFDAEPVADGTIPKHLRKTKPVEPAPVDIEDIPLIDPPNRIAPPPTQIYPTSPIPAPNNFIFIPDLPRRILPDADKVSTNTARQYTSNTGDSLINHKFGCLLARPYYEQSIEWCDYNVVDNFWDSLIYKMEQFVNELIDDLENDRQENALKKAFVFLALPRMDRPVQIRSVEAITDISNYYWKRSRILNNYPITGLISVGGVNLVSCQGQDIPVPKDDLEISLKDGEFDECGIPLSLFQPEQGSRGNQLQILWKNDTLKGYRKQLSIPFAKDLTNATTDEIKSSIPTSLNFGQTLQKIELKNNNANSNNLSRQGIVRVFTDLSSPTSQLNFVQNTIQSMINDFCIPGIMIDSKKTNSTIFADDINIQIGTFYSYRAIYMGWNSTLSKWEKLANWNLI